MTKEQLKLSELPDDVMLTNNHYRDETSVGDLKHDLEHGLDSRKKSLRKCAWYIADLHEMQKYRIDGIIEDIVEDMDSQCEDWQDRYGDSQAVESLRFYMQKAYDEFRETLDKIGNNKVYSCIQEVLIDL